MPLSPKTPVSVSVAGWASICLTVGVFGWQANNYLRDFRDNEATLAREIHDMQATRWTISDQERYNYQLERLNRDKSLNVPNLHDFGK